MTPTPADYIRAGFTLVPIPHDVNGRPQKGPKGPSAVGWNLRENAVCTIEAAEALNGCGVGLAHAWSRTCAIDADNYLQALTWLAAHGIYLDALLSAPDTVQISSGRENRAKAIFKLPDDVIWLPTLDLRQDHGVDLELRCALKGGSVTSMDVLPPSLHELTLRPYQWTGLGDWRHLPVLPQELLALWRELANSPKRPTGRPEGGKVREGARNAYLTSRAGSMRRDGFGEGAIRASLLVVNKEEIEEPLPDTEVAKISVSVAKYPPGEQHQEGPGESRVLLARGDTLSVKPIRWTWNGYLACGKLHVLAGAIGTGKSTLAIDFAAVVTTGGLWPDGTKCDPGDVLVWSDEDDPEDTLLPRFLAAGGDPRRIHFVTGTVDRDGKRHFDPATDIPLLIAAARDTTDLRLVIVDPVVTVVAGDSHKNTEVRRALRPLVGLASELDVAALGVTHHTKGTVGRDPVERITGSLAFGALPRVTMAAARDGSDPERRIFCRTKSNIGPDTGGWEYRLALTDVPGAEVAMVVVARWGERLEGSAKDLLAGAEAPAGDPDPGDEAKATESAVDWLRELLLYGSVDSKEVSSSAKQSGFSWRTIERAKARLGVKSTRAGFAGEGKWRWSLPLHIVPKDEEAPSTHSDVGGLWETTPLKPSSDAGSTIDRQGPNGPTPSTPLKPSSDAGSTIDRQAFGENKSVGGLCSNPVVARVPGGSDDPVGGLCSNPVVARVPGDQSSIDRQGVACVGENDGDGPLYHDVVITIDHGKGTHRSFPAHDPEGRTLDVWKAKVLAAHGDSATVRPAPVNGGV